MKSKILLPKYLVLLVITFFGITAFAQQNNGKIKGTVTTSDGGPAAGVNVILKNSKYSNITNDEGNFELNRIKTGSYTLQISLTGYETTQQEVTVTENQTVNLNLRLKVSNKELQEVVIKNKKSIASKKTDYVARMPISNLENPQVYSVIHKELLQEQIIIDINNAVRNSPGVIPTSYPSGGFGVSFRGFSTGVNARNGMETVTGRSSVDLSNVERIEIMKGPSGTLFGSSVTSFGGVVNLVTKKPFETAATEISYITGSFGLNRLTADVNTPLNKDKTVLFRVNLAVNKEKSFLDYGFNNTLAITPSLTYKATDKLTFNIDTELYNVNNTRRTYNGAYASGITSIKDVKLDYKKTLFHDDLDAKTSATKVFAQAEYEIAENWKSTTVFSYVDENVERSYQTNITWNSPTQAATRVSLYGPIYNNYTNIQENINGQFATGSIKHKFLAGTNYRLFKSNFTYGTTPFFTAFDVTTNFTPIRRKAVDAVVPQIIWPVANQETFSIYACDVINFTDRLSAMLSLRLDNFERKKIGTTEGYHQTALAPKLGLVYELVKDQVSIFGNYMNGFQNNQPVQQPNNGGLLVLDPTYAVQYEGGIKAETFNKKLSASISYYNIKIDNVTRTDTAGYYVQDGVQVSKGLDFELIANPTAGLNLVAGYAYNDNRIVKTSESSKAIEGNKATGSPENVVNFWATYTFQNKLKGLGAGFGGNFVDKSYMFADNVFYIPSYTVINATIFYDQPTWRVGVKLNNIANEKYWDTYANSQTPTNFAINLTLKF